MSTLRTDYIDDVFTGKRKYEEINNGDGTVSFNDVTDYSQHGDKYGAAQINELNTIVNNLDAVTHKTTDTAETSIADNDYFPFYDTSAGKQRKTLWSNTKTVLINTFAIKNHASNQTTYGLSSSNLFGHCKLYDDYTTNGGAASAGVGASSKALYDAYTSNKNAINTANGNITTLQRNLNTTNSNLATLTNTVTTDSGDISSLKARVTSNERNITSLGTRASALENELTANNNRIYLDYHNGIYGINTNSNRSVSSFIPFRRHTSVFSQRVVAPTPMDVKSVSVSYTLAQLGLAGKDIEGVFINDIHMQVQTDTPQTSNWQADAMCRCTFDNNTITVTWWTSLGDVYFVTGSSASATLYVFYYD